MHSSRLAKWTSKFGRSPKSYFNRPNSRVCQKTVSKFQRASFNLSYPNAMLTELSITTPSPTPSTPAQSERVPRGRNFKQSEDEQICRSWLNISQDGAVGTDQDNNTFWNRIHAHYITNGTVGADMDMDRSEQAISSRWGEIQKCVNKFCGAFAQIEARERSGANTINKVSNDACNGARTIC